MTAPTTDDKTAVRIEAIGETEDSGILSDDIIAYYWQSVAGAGSVLMTAALCCDALAARAASAFRFSADGSSIDKTMLMNQYRANAAELRRRYLTGYGSGSIALTRVGNAAETEYGF